MPGNPKECQIVVLLMLMYLAVTIMLYISLNGNMWVSYQDGYSGMWNDCNTTKVVTNQTRSSKSDKDDDVECDYIHVSEAAGTLHGIRALFIIGYITWCLGLVQRYLTWQDRGTSVDKSVIISTITSSLLIFTASLIFTLVYYDEHYRTNPKYSNPSLASHHALAYVGSSMAGFVGLLTVRHHFLLKQTDTTFNWTKNCPLFRSCCMPLQCCGKRIMPCHSTTQQQQASSESNRSQRQRRHSSASDPTRSTLEISVISSDSRDNHSGSRQRQYSLSSLGALFSFRRNAGVPESGRNRRDDGTDEVDTISVVTISEETGRGRRHADSMRGSRVIPLDFIARPPTYDDVIRENRTQDDNVNPPPSYDEVIENREIILSPPPPYEAHVT